MKSIEVLKQMEIDEKTKMNENLGSENGWFHSIVAGVLTRINQAIEEDLELQEAIRIHELKKLIREQDYFIDVDQEGLNEIEVTIYKNCDSTNFTEKTELEGLEKAWSYLCNLPNGLVKK